MNLRAQIVHQAKVWRVSYQQEACRPNWDWIGLEANRGPYRRVVLSASTPHRRADTAWGYRLCLLDIGHRKQTPMIPFVVVGKGEARYRADYRNR